MWELSKIQNFNGPASKTTGPVPNGFNADYPPSSGNYAPTQRAQLPNGFNATNVRAQLPQKMAPTPLLTLMCGNYQKPRTPTTQRAQLPNGFNAETTLPLQGIIIHMHQRAGPAAQLWACCRVLSADIHAYTGVIQPMLAATIEVLYAATLSLTGHVSVYCQPRPTLWSPIQAVTSKVGRFHYCLLKCARERMAILSTLVWDFTVPVYIWHLP